MEQNSDEILLSNKNKAIAEFAGWKLELMGDKDAEIDDDFKFYWFCLYNDKGGKIASWNGDECELLSENSTISFHDDWDWLMPVIEKIEERGYKFKICRKRCQICLDDKDENFIIDVKLDSKLQSAHEAVYQFTQKIK